MNALTDGIKKGRKFDQVLQGAREVFLKDGFEGASVDDIARVANVSKATLYNYFPDKRLLFIEVIKAECAQQADSAIALINEETPFSEMLRLAADHLLRFLVSDFGMATFRICVAESDRFPELGHIFYDSGPRRVHNELEKYMTMAVECGALAIDDIPLAAAQFAELCKADIFPKVMFGVQREFSEAEINRITDGAVRTFLCRHGVDDNACMTKNKPAPE